MHEKPQQQHVSIITLSLLILKNFKKNLSIKKYQINQNQTQKPINISSTNYYGDLDLANLRNTEVQAGLAERPAAAAPAVRKPTVNRPVVRRPVVAEPELLPEEEAFV